MESQKVIHGGSLNSPDSAERASCRHVLFCGDAGKDIKKLQPTAVPSLAGATFALKKVRFPSID